MKIKSTKVGFVLLCHSGNAISYVIPVAFEPESTVSFKAETQKLDPQQKRSRMTAVDIWE
ncbi:MAG: hypothetical protein ACJA2G_001931 [Cognaticolwellia sp.]|jgi:hypothetical protein